MEHSATGFLDLPTEIRLAIIRYVFESTHHGDGFCNRGDPRGVIVDEDYTAVSNLSLLLTCRQFHNDFATIAFTNTPFLVTDTYTTVPARLNILHPSQVSAIRSLSFVIGARQFRDMVHWANKPFNIPSLRLDRLTIVLHRSAHWHYPSDFTTDLVALLRRLEGVQNLVFVRNASNVKGHFKTWVNRLIGLILREDHYQRYDAVGAPNLETTWWAWEYDGVAQSFHLQALRPKPLMDEESYLVAMKPFVDDLITDMASEEEDPDPRSRNGWA